MTGSRSIGTGKLLRPVLALFILITGWALIFPLLSYAASSAGASSRPPQIKHKTDTGSYREGEVLVRFRKGVTAATARSTASAHAMNVAKHYEFLSGKKGKTYMLLKSAGMSTRAMISALGKDPGVEYVSPNYARKPLVVPNDPRFGQQWALQNTGQTVKAVAGTAGADIKAPAAWDVSTGTAGVVISVIDSGVDYTHEDLAANIWTNPAAGSPGHVPDTGNGCGVPVHGCDFASDDLGTNGPNPMDIESHGTHVAGIASAAGNNNKGIAGANWNAKIVALKAMSPDGSFYDSNTIEAIQYAVMMKSNGVNIAAINASWGGPDGGQHDLLKDAISAAGAAGIVFVAAAGNNFTNNDLVPIYPASYNLPNIIAVAATDQNDALATFSDFGLHSVEIGAPGVNIVSSIAHCVQCNSAEASISINNSSTQAYTIDYARMTPSTGLTATGYNCGYGLTAADFPAGVRNNIAVIQRGPTTSSALISDKVTNAMNAGAIAAIIYCNDPAVCPQFTLGSPGYWIPAVSISNADGLTLVGALPVQVTIVSPPYDYYDGTSMATPFVTGAAALVSAQYPADDMYHRIDRVLSGVDRLSALNGKTASSGRLDLFNSLSSGLILDPLVVGLSRTTGLFPATQFTVNGINFGASAGSVLLNSDAGPVAAGIVSWTDTSITASVPQGAGKFVSVKRPDGKESVKKFPVSAWAQKTSAHEARFDAAAARYLNKIYVFGGYRYDTNPALTTLSSAEFYDVTTNTWTTVAAMPEPKEWSAAATLSGKIYLAGGFDVNTVNGYFDTVEVYDPLTNTYAVRNPLPEARSEAGMVNLNGVLYLSGGDTIALNATTSLYRYNSVADSWSALAPMATARRSHGMVALNNKIYVFGGYDNSGLDKILKSGEVYDVAGGTWSNIADMPVPLVGMGAVTDGRYIYAVGGKSDAFSAAAPPTKVFMRYDPTANTWSYQAADINELIMSKSFAPAVYMPSYGIFSAPGYTVELATNVTNEMALLQLPLSGSVSPASNNFGDINAGNSAPFKTFTITNTGADGLILGTLAISGDISFTLRNDVCSGHTLAASATCTFDISFAPVTGGAKTASVLIPSNAAPSPIPAVALSGNSIKIFTDATGAAISTQVASNQVTLAGLSGPSAISIVGGQYSINGGAYSSAAGTVNNGDRITVRVTASGLYSTTTTATLTIAGVNYLFSVTTVSRPQTIKVSGVLLKENFSSGIPAAWTNVDAWTTDNTVCPRTLAAPFAAPWAIVDSGCRTTTVETLTTSSFSAKDCTTADLSFTSQSAWNGGSGAVDVSADGGTTWVNKLALNTNEGPVWRTGVINEIAGSANSKVRFVYTGSAAGAYWAIDNIWISCRPAALKFTASGQQHTVLVENTGTANLLIGAASISGAGASHFTIPPLTDGCSGSTLLPDESCAMDVQFSAAAGTTATATLNIPSNDPATPTATVALNGTTIAIGDVDGSGTINIVDALFVARYSAGLSVSTFNASAADVNCDGTINIVDALFIARKAAVLTVTGWCGL